MARPVRKNPNAGGSTSSSTKGYQHFKGGSQLANDSKALNGAECFGADENLLFDEPYKADPADRQYGMPYDILSSPGNVSPATQGNEGWTKAAPGPGVENRGAKKVSGSRDPEPGGGW